MPTDFPDLPAEFASAETAWRHVQAQHTLLTRTLGQLPAAVATLSGPEHRYTFFNAQYQAIATGQAELGRTVAEVHPEVVEQGFVDLLDQVYTTGQPFVGSEVLVQLYDATTGQATPRYADLVYQPLTDEQGQVTGILTFIVEVNKQVQARQELETQERHTNLLNEELQAANEEIRANNDELTYAQAQLRQLNEELEARVQDQTQQVLRAQAATEAQRQLLHDVLHQAPIAIAYLDGADHRIQVANPTVCELWGRPEAELLGWPLLDALSELQGQGVDALLNGVLHSGEPYTGTELPFQLRRHGQLETIYFNFVYHPQRNAQGQTTGVLVVATDTTAQVHARQRLEAQERQTSQLNEELATINEELTAANEEIRATNDALQRAQEALRALNEQLEVRVQQRTAEAETERATLLRTFTQAPVALAIMTGPEYVLTFANDSMGHLWGRPAAAIVGRPHFEALPDLVGQGLETVFYDVFHNEQPYHQRDELVRIDRAGTGELVPGYFDIVYQPLRAAGGEVIGIICMASEVTAQVRARQQVQHLNEQLTTALRDVERQRLRLEQFIMRAPALLCVFDGPDFVFELVNPPYQELFAGRALLGRPLREALPDLADAGTLPLLEQVYRTGQPFEGTEQLVPVRRTPDGPVEEHYYNLLYQARRNASGEVDGLLVFVTDVTEQVLARQQVQHLNEDLATINQELTVANQELMTTNQQLTRTNADLDNFIYSASHDLKAPISNIEGLLLLLREDLLPAACHNEEEVAPVLTKMQEAVERFKRTIEHLTDVSKLQLEFSRPAVPTDLSPVLDDVRQDLLPLLTETGGQLTADLSTSPTLVISEKNLRSVLYNLVSNALKYRHPDRPPLVQLSCRVEGDRHVLRVQDNGLGLSTWQQGKLFGLFQRLHTHVEGTGVGLYMVKNIVENAGGTLTVESQEGVGSTFVVALPAVAV